MSARSIARRYGRALFDVAQRADAIDQVGRDLADVSGAVSGHEQLARVLSSPAIPVPVKRAIVGALLESARELSPLVGRLLGLLADRGRLGILSEVAAAYADRVMDHARVTHAVVVSAAPLGDERRTALAAALGRATGRQVTMRESVDPALIGGLVARVGGTIFDGSVARQLERLHERLRAQA